MKDQQDGSQEENIKLTKFNDNQEEIMKKKEN